MKKIFFKTKDNIKLCGILETPPKKTDKCVILAHGITVDKSENGLYETLAKKLIEEGIASFRFDFRGHGESKGKQQDMTIKGELVDIQTSCDLISKSFKKIAVLGASFGGGIATLFTSENKSRIVSLCLWNPVLNFDHTFLNPVLPELVKSIKKMKLDLKKQGWTKLGRAQFKTGEKLYKEMKIYKPYLKIREINIPTLIIHGNKDTKVPYQDSLKYSENLLNGRLIAINGAKHGFHESWESKIAIKESVIFFSKHF